MTKANDLTTLEKLVEQTAHRNESIIHKALKQWVCIELYNKGVPVDKFEFEKKIRYDDKSGHYYKHTVVDVFVNHNGCLAYYCQCKNDYPWLYKFLEHVPALKKHSKQQFIVFPENLEALYPMRWQQYIKELKQVDIEVLSAPFHIPIENKQHIQIDMTYDALNKLVKIKNKFNYKKPLIDFIEKDLERIIKQREGFPLD